MADIKLEGVLYRHDMTRHTVPLTVNGDYAFSDRHQMGFHLDPTKHMGEVYVPFQKTKFWIGFLIIVVVPIYISIIRLTLPESPLYTYILGGAVLLAPVALFLLVRWCAPSIKRRIYGIWGEPDPLNLFDLYQWDHQLAWERARSLQRTSKANARLESSNPINSSFLLNAVAWVILASGVLIALVVVVGLLK